jgi:hypothetical protein
MYSDNKWRFVIGFLTVAGLMMMALAFALGKVEEATSYGLIPVLSFLGIVVTRFAEWCYDTKRRQDNDVPTPAVATDEPTDKQ